MIVISEAGHLPEGPSAAAVEHTTGVARLLGCRVYTIPPDFERCETAENALWALPEQAAAVKEIWLGFLPTLERYRAIYAAAAAKNVFLVNNPDQHQLAMELDLAYPYLEGLTPRSVVARSVSESEAAGDVLGFPVFIKGAVQSRKRQGWTSCVAEDVGHLRELTAWLLTLDEGSRGRVIVRELVPLRHQRTTGLGVPVSREYRCFLYAGELLQHAYYWPEEDDYGPLTGAETTAVRDLASEVATRLPVPYLSVDVGQLVDGSWTAIEVNEAQFSGLAHVDPLHHWSSLIDAVDARH